jgi:hypothetical protein
LPAYATKIAFICAARPACRDKAEKRLHSPLHRLRCGDNLGSITRIPRGMFFG